MGKNLNASGAGAIRTIMKNKDDFHFELRKKEQDGKRMNYLYDVFYENAAGTLNMAVENGQVVIAALNLSLGKVITLHNDKNLAKLASYVLEKDGQ